MTIHSLRHELSALLGLALPILVAQLAGTAMGFADTLMAGRASAQDLAAVALGNALWLPLFLLMNGILLAVSLQVSRLDGEQRPEAIGPLTGQALWLGLGLGLLCGLLLHQADWLLARMTIDPALRQLTGDYLAAIGWGFPGMGLYQVLRCLSDGLGRPQPGMLAGLGGLLANILLNALLIYGQAGLPRLGATGCGWATSLAALGMLLAMTGWISRAACYRPCQLRQGLRWPKGPALRALLGLGLPVGVAIFAEVSLFSVIALLIADWGEAAVAGHQIALSVTSVVFMVPLALGMAITLRVGQALGRREPGQARLTARTGLGMALVYASLSASLIALFSSPLASLYNQDPQVIRTAVGLLQLAALFQFSDGLQIAAAGALRGYQDTRAIMLLTLVAYWLVGLPLGSLLGLTDWLGPARGPRGLWMGLVAGLSSAALLLGLRLRYRARRETALFRPEAAAERHSPAEKD